MWVKEQGPHIHIFLKRRIVTYAHKKTIKGGKVPKTKWFQSIKDPKKRVLETTTPTTMCIKDFFNFSSVASIVGFYVGCITNKCIEAQ